VYAVALAIFSTDGFINNFLNNIMHISANTNYLMSGSHIWLKMLLWGMWKGVGWSAIIYISSISGIDPSLYEAAEIDGANRFQKDLECHDSAADADVLCTAADEHSQYTVQWTGSVPGILQSGEFQEH
jgi:hypothetical protein